MDANRQDLLKAALGPHRVWTKPVLVATVGPHHPSVFDEYDRRRASVISDLEEKLEQYGDGELAVLRCETADDPTGVRSDWRQFRDGRLKQLGRQPPPWYAASLGHPGHLADVDYWSRMAHFTIDELLCLSVGVAPSSLPPDTIAELLEGDVETYWPPIQFLLLRREQLIREFSHGKARPRVYPRDFLGWVDQVALEVHPEFLRLLRRHHLDGRATETASTQAAAPDKREIDTIAQLFTAMAIDQLGYDPKAARSSTPREIADIAASMGLSVSPETIRKYLKIGAGFIPLDWRRE